MKTISLDKAKEAKKLLLKELGEFEGVVGIGIGERNGEYVIVVYLRSEETEARIPKKKNGVPVTVEVSGEATFLGAS